MKIHQWSIKSSTIGLKKIQPRQLKLIQQVTFYFHLILSKSQWNVRRILSKKIKKENLILNILFCLKKNKNHNSIYFFNMDW